MEFLKAVIEIICGSNVLVHKLKKNAMSDMPIKKIDCAQSNCTKTVASSIL
jgi:hypothetical protein